MLCKAGILLQVVDIVLQQDKNPRLRRYAPLVFRTLSILAVSNSPNNFLEM